MRGSPSRSSQKPVSAREVSEAQNKMKLSPHTPICSAPHADPLMTGRCSNPLFSMRENKGTVSCTSSSSDSVRLDQTWYSGGSKGRHLPLPTTVKLIRPAQYSCFHHSTSLRLASRPTGPPSPSLSSPSCGGSPPLSTSFRAASVNVAKLPVLNLRHGCPSILRLLPS